MKTVMFVDKQGNVSGLADDLLDKFNCLGFKRVNRVSNIEYDHNDMCWVAKDVEGHTIASHPVRSSVIELEREYYNNLTRQGFLSV